MSAALTEHPLQIAICCYPTFGGSGIMATELARSLANRGHRVHVVAYAMPARFDRFNERLWFHEVEAFEYPLFPQSPYALALASKLVALHRYHDIDVVHVHYAVPHATSAYLAGQVLGAGRPRLVTTLHGTDTTLVGAHPSYLPITRFSVEQSDCVTVPSEFLRGATYESLGISRELPIEVVPNFVDTERYRPAAGDRRRALRHLFHGSGPAVTDTSRVLIHASNFRPVKRVQDVLEVFARVVEQEDAFLVFVGDGPERSRVEAQSFDRGLASRVRFLGKQTCFVELLQGSDVFVLPSESESFGLAALEAMACGVPVVAAKVGGVPEVVIDGLHGRLVDVGDTDAMAAAVRWLWSEPGRWEQLGRAARARALSAFSMDPIVDRFEALYRGGSAAG